MNFSEISSAVERNAVPLVFVNVLMQQLGLPVPTVPTLLLAGSLALGPPPLGQALGAAMLASVLANAAWYGAGRAFGYRVLSGLRTSQTEPIAGAVVAEHDRLAQAVGDWPKHRAVVTICACPQDAGAVEAARRLVAQGCLQARPLKGGCDAWLQEAALAGSAAGPAAVATAQPRDGQRPA